MKVYEVMICSTTNEVYHIEADSEAEAREKALMGEDIGIPITRDEAVDDAKVLGEIQKVEPLSKETKDIIEKIVMNDQKEVYDTYEKVANKKFMGGRLRERFLQYMRGRWANSEWEKCMSGYAFEWADRFLDGREYERSDGAGKELLEKIDALKPIEGGLNE